MKNIFLGGILFLICNTLFCQNKRRSYSKSEIHSLETKKPERSIPSGLITSPPPSDAIILFNGNDIKAWNGNFKIKDSTIMVATKGGLKTKQSFGDMQLHLEWRANDTLRPNGQKGANSGVYIMGRYEVQILESFVNETYADGQAGAIYGQYPPLVNASTPQGNWNSYDIIFKAPIYENGEMKEKAKITLLHNGILIQNNQEYEGPTKHKVATAYPKNHPKKAPIFLQYHNDPIEYRNIWIRELNTSKNATAIDKKWEQLFKKGKENIDYTTSLGKFKDKQNQFNVVDNGVEVLYHWKGNEAPFGMITTEKQYSNYNLEFEYKWGERKFIPRLNVKRDAGVLFHVYKEKTVWPSSLECQIQEGDTGDLWVIKGPKVFALNKNGSSTTLDSSGEEKFQHNIKYATHEIVGWNLVRLEVRSSNSAKFFVNGHLVNEIQQLKDENGKPLTQGCIALQAEGAEISYRNIRIQELK